MGNDIPEVDELKNREANKDDDGDDQDVDVDGGGGLLGGVSLGLSKRQLLIIGLIVALGLMWYLKSNSDDDGESDEVNDVRESGPDLDDVEITQDEDQDGVEIKIPANPDDDLEKDAAVIEMLKQKGYSFGED